MILCLLCRTGIQRAQLPSSSDSLVNATRSFLILLILSLVNIFSLNEILTTIILDYYDRQIPEPSLRSFYPNFDLNVLTCSKFWVLEHFWILLMSHTLLASILAVLCSSSRSRWRICRCSDPIFSLLKAESLSASLSSVSEAASFLSAERPAALDFKGSLIKTQNQNPKIQKNRKIQNVWWSFHQ